MSKVDYNKLDKEELIKIIERMEYNKKYGLVWEDSNENCENEITILNEIKDRKIVTDNNKSTNILIEGDNYHALSILNNDYKEKVDVIYIDPPYNTGAKNWKYNNNYVEKNNQFKHSRWISMMYKRLILAKELLKEDGIICITIDNYELASLWLLMNEIFGESNHLGTVIIRSNPTGRMTKKKFSLVHEYAIFFGKTSLANIKKTHIDIESKSHNYKKDKDNSWYSPTNLRKQGICSSAIDKNGKLLNRYYPIYFDPINKRVSTKDKLQIEILPIDKIGEKRIWRRSKDVIDEMYRKGDIWVQETNNGYQVYYKFRGGLDGQMPKSIWYDAKYSASEYGTPILNSIIGKREVFQYAKSLYAVKDCILSANNNKDAIILDFFAGSGTTGHAVLELNKEDGGNRKFILCTNNENNICSDICYPRLKKVIEGYKTTKDKEIIGLGGNLKYYKIELNKEL